MERNLWTRTLCAAALLLMLAACGTGTAQNTPDAAPTPDSPSVTPASDEFLEVCPTPAPGTPVLSDEERAANARAAVLRHSGVPEEEIVSMNVIVDDSL